MFKNLINHPEFFFLLAIILLVLVGICNLFTNVILHWLAAGGAGL